MSRPHHATSLGAVLAALLVAFGWSIDTVGAQDGNAQEGSEVFKKCRACHDVGPEAKNKVVGIVPHVTESEFDRNNQELCDAYPDWESVIWLGRKGGTGKALCLAPNKNASA